jgi:hypothetical protein
MASLEQIQQDIETLSQEALDLVAQFIQLLKKSSPTVVAEAPPTKPTPDSDISDWSDFIGCVEAEEDLSINYKAYLAEGLDQKYVDY